MCKAAHFIIIHFNIYTVYIYIYYTPHYTIKNNYVELTNSLVISVDLCQRMRLQPVYLMDEQTACIYPTEEPETERRQS